VKINHSRVENSATPQIKVHSNLYLAYIHPRGNSGLASSYPGGNFSHGIILGCYTGSKNWLRDLILFVIPHPVAKRSFQQLFSTDADVTVYVTSSKQQQQLLLAEFLITSPPPLASWSRLRHTLDILTSLSILRCSGWGGRGQREAEATLKR